MGVKKYTYVGPMAVCTGNVRHPYEIQDAFNERLSCINDETFTSKEGHVWIPNVDYPSEYMKDWYDLDGKESGFAEIKDISNEIEAFAQAFPEALAVLQKNYEQVKVQFGVVTYWY